LAVLSEKLRSWLGTSWRAHAAGEYGRSEHAGPGFDRESLGRSLGADEAAFSAALLLFERQTGPALEALADALRAGEIELARSIAHRIRGGAGMLGALRLAQRCGEIGRTPAAETAALADLLSLARQDYAAFLDDPTLRRQRASGSGCLEGF
jgi:HPt (histidine-containing phosphotransfer) domain-containing protein